MPAGFKIYYLMEVRFSLGGTDSNSGTASNGEQGLDERED